MSHRMSQKIRANAYAHLYKKKDLRNCRNESISPYKKDKL